MRGMNLVVYLFLIVALIHLHVVDAEPRDNRAVDWFHGKQGTLRSNDEVKHDLKIFFSGWNLMPQKNAMNLISNPTAGNQGAGRIGNYLFLLGGLFEDENCSMSDFLSPTRTSRNMFIFDSHTNQMVQPLQYDLSVEKKAVLKTAQLATAVVGPHSTVEGPSKLVTIGFCNQIPSSVQFNADDYLAADEFRTFLRTVQIVSLLPKNLTTTKSVGGTETDVFVKVEKVMLETDVILRFNATCVYNDNFVYIMGGILFDTLLDGVVTTLNTVSMFDFETSQFIESAWTIEGFQKKIIPHSHGEFLFLKKSVDVLEKGNVAIGIGETVSILNTQNGIYFEDVSFPVTRDVINSSSEVRIDVEALREIEERTIPQVFTHNAEIFFLDSAVNYNNETRNFDWIVAYSLGGKRGEDLGPRSEKGNPDENRNGASRWGEQFPRHDVAPSFIPQRHYAIIKNFPTEEYFENYVGTEMILNSTTRKPQKVFFQRQVVKSAIRLYMLGGYSLPSKIYLHDVFSGDITVSHESTLLLTKDEYVNATAHTKNQNELLEILDIEYVDDPLARLTKDEHNAVKTKVDNLSLQNEMPLWTETWFKIRLSKAFSAICALNKREHYPVNNLNNIHESPRECELIFSSTPNCNDPLVTVRESELITDDNGDVVAGEFKVSTTRDGQCTVMKKSATTINDISAVSSSSEKVVSNEAHSSLHLPQEEHFLYLCASTKTVTLKADTKRVFPRRKGAGGREPHRIPPSTADDLYEKNVYFLVNGKRGLMKATDMQYFLYHNEAELYKKYFSDEGKTAFWPVYISFILLAVFLSCLCYRLYIYRKYYYIKFFRGFRTVNGEHEFTSDDFGSDNAFDTRCAKIKGNFSEEMSSPTANSKSDCMEMIPKTVVQPVGENGGDIIVNDACTQKKKKRGKKKILQDKYQVIKVLGKGSFSVVYLVRRIKDQKYFALKYIACVSDVDRMVAMKECEVIYSLRDHPNIIKLFEMFLSYSFDGDDDDSNNDDSDGGQEYTAREKKNINPNEATKDHKIFQTGRYLSLVLEYHEKGDLGSYVRNCCSLKNQSWTDKSFDGKNNIKTSNTGQTVLKNADFLPEHLVVSVAFQVLSVLEYMHAHDPPILHRDLKPENILLSSNPDLLSPLATTKVPICSSKCLPVVVSDFGLSRVMEQSFCESGVGSLPYVAPECWQRQYSEKVDIWSLGCILYAMCSFRVERNNVKVMFSECNHPDFLNTLQGEIVSFGYSPELAAFIACMLAVDPVQRLSAVAALQYLEHVSKGRNAALLDQLRM